MATDLGALLHPPTHVRTPCDVHTVSLCSLPQGQPEGPPTRPTARATILLFLTLLCGEATPRAEAPDVTPPYTAPPSGDRGDREDDDVGATLELDVAGAGATGRKHVRQRVEPGESWTMLQLELPTPNGHPHSVRHPCGGTVRDHTRGRWSTPELAFKISSWAGSAAPRSAFAVARDSSSAKYPTVRGSASGDALTARS